MLRNGRHVYSLDLVVHAGTEGYGTYLFMGVGDTKEREIEGSRQKADKKMCVSRVLDSSISGVTRPMMLQGLLDPNRIT